MSAAAAAAIAPDDRREVFGWISYQWAFHGFVTTVATVLLGPYLTDLAQAAVGANGPVFELPLLQPTFMASPAIAREAMANQWALRGVLLEFVMVNSPLRLWTARFSPPRGDGSARATGFDRT